MKKRRSYIALVCIGVLSIAMTILGDMMAESLLCDMVNFVPLIGYIVAIAILWRMGESKTVRVLCGLLFGLLCVHLIQQGMITYANFQRHCMGKQATTIMGNEAIYTFVYGLTYYKLATQFVLMLMLFNLDTNIFNFLMLGGLISVILNTALFTYFTKFYAYLPEQWNLLAYAVPWTVVDMVLESLWCLGAVIMGICGIVKTRGRDEEECVILETEESVGHLSSSEE